MNTTHQKKECYWTDWERQAQEIITSLENQIKKYFDEQGNSLKQEHLQDVKRTVEAIKQILPRQIQEKEAERIGIGITPVYEVMLQLLEADLEHPFSNRPDHRSTQDGKPCMIYEQIYPTKIGHIDLFQKMAVFNDRSPSKPISAELIIKNPQEAAELHNYY